jgi:hypothetical protein
MAARSAWKGYLKLSLVSVPVKAYTASASEGAEIKLNQLHQECKSRIQYKKSCPIHGQIPSDQKRRDVRPNLCVRRERNRRRSKEGAGRGRIDLIRFSAPGLRLGYLGTAEQ